MSLSAAAFKIKLNIRGNSAGGQKVGKITNLLTNCTSLRSLKTGVVEVKFMYKTGFKDQKLSQSAVQ